MSEKYTYKRREFLNPDETLTAFISAIVTERQISKSAPLEAYAYPTFTLSDCNRKINLEFGYSGEDEKEEARQKLRLFRQIVNEFADALEVEMDKPKPVKKVKKKNVKTNKTKSTNKA